MQIDFDQYVDNVFRFALSLTSDQHLAEDLTQECFLRAMSRSHQLKNSKAARAWLFKILVNLWKDYLKAKRTEREHTCQLQHVSELNSPDKAAIMREEMQIVWETMRSLPQRQRTVLFLRTVEQFTNEEASELLEISVNSVKANLSIARKTVRKKLVDRQIARETKT